MLHLFAGKGHLPVFSAPEESCAVLRGFVRDRVAPNGAKQPPPALLNAVRHRRAQGWAKRWQPRGARAQAGSPAARRSRGRTRINVPRLT